MDTLTADALVRTDRPGRYAAQLAKHLGHRLQTEWNDTHGHIALPEGAGRCDMQTEPDGLRLHATAPDTAGLARLEDVVKRHLERWGEKDGIVVDFHRS